MGTGWSFVLARIAAAALCFAAISKQPYNFYILTRWVVFGVCVWGIWLERKRAVPIAGIAYAALGLLFNPVLPFRFSRETWMPLDIVAGVLLLASLSFSPPREKD